MSDPIERAIQAGKIPTSRRGHYKRLMKLDPCGTARTLAQLTPILGVSTAATAPVPDGYPREWLAGTRRQAGHVFIAHD